VSKTRLAARNRRNLFYPSQPFLPQFELFPKEKTSTDQIDQEQCLQITTPSLFLAPKSFFDTDAKTGQELFLRVLE